MSATCFSCEQERLGAAAARSERIWVGEHWRVVHAIHCALPGWLILIPRRHVEAMAALTDAEAVELGRLEVAVSAALHEVVGCVKTYVVQFAEAAGFAHTHVHVIPRAADLPEEFVGPGVFGYLTRPESEWVSSDVVDGLVDRLGPAIGRAVAGGAPA